MHNESYSIMARRFMDRFLESGLLVIAVALGIGAASAGIALMANTIGSSRAILDSAGYKEIVVSTAGKAEDMDEAVSLMATAETAILSSEDLDAGELVPAVRHSYVKNNSRLHLINEETVTRDANRPAPPENEADPPKADSSNDNPPAEDPPFIRYSKDDLSDASLQPDVVISDLERISGFEITPGFFDSRNITLLGGSLFSQQDMKGNARLVLLGEELAENLLSSDDDILELLGKKILTREGLVTVVGIFADDESDLFYAPYRSAGTGDFRRMFMNTQLRFYVDETEELDAAAGQLQSWFDNKFGKQQIVVSNPQAEADQLIKRNMGLSVLIMILSMSGLFIASVNISNILMSRTMRMKKHVGILMALGASRQRISRLFTAESLGITVLGTLLGMLVSLPLSRFMQASLNMEGGSWIYSLAGVLLSAILILSFGLMPARQYSKIDPAMAMHSA